jgi:S-adenosylmethionine synthetase
VIGEISTNCYVDIPGVVRKTVKEVGYTRAKFGFDGDTCAVLNAIDEQSPDIARGVDRSWEIKTGTGQGDPLAEVGAGDQGMMFGFACDETPELMPLPIALAQKICRRLAQVRREGTLGYLRPDGKSQVTVQYENDRPVRLDAIVVAAQHSPDISLEELRSDIKKHVIEPVVPANLIDAETRFYINPTGRFVVGGPQGDAGVTGRKIIVDTYGGYARHGGGAFSGKDPTKVDRSASYAARYVAKNIVAAGLARRCEVQLSYAIGVATPISIAIDTFGTGQLSDKDLNQLVRENFDLRPAAIIKELDLQKPIYSPLSAYGHFGRTDLDLPWERTDKIELLKKAVTTFRR